MINYKDHLSLCHADHCITFNYDSRPVNETTGLYTMKNKGKGLVFTSSNLETQTVIISNVVHGVDASGCERISKLILHDRHELESLTISCKIRSCREEMSTKI